MPKYLFAGIVNDMASDANQKTNSLADRELCAPHVLRLDPDRPDYELILATHLAALEASENGYKDPQSGAFVFTAAALADRGYCCKSGCRHCPYLD